MSNKLHIYACSGVGNVKNRYDYWTDNTNTACNTQAVNNLLSKINLSYAEAEYLPLDDNQVLERLDKVDLYCVCLDAAQRYADNTELLHKAGLAIGSMVSAGQFECNDTTNAGRNKNLDRLLLEADRLLEMDVRQDAKWMDWWQQNVEDLNRVGLSEDQQAAAVSGVGAADYTENADLAKYLDDAGEYFLYTFFTDEQLKTLPYLFTRKKKTQKNVYQYCLSTYKSMLGTQSAMDAIIRAGIIKDFGDTPENVVNKICSTYDKDDVKGVGVITEIAIADIIAIISVVASLIGGIVTAICQAVAKVKVAETSVIDTDLAAQDAPFPEDYQEGWFKDLLDALGGSGSSNILLIGAAAVAALLILKK